MVTEVTDSADGEVEVSPEEGAAILRGIRDGNAGRVKSPDEVRKLILGMEHMAEKPTYEELMAENARLKAAKEKRGSISFKVSEKGALSVYGMGRFPVTLYKEQWLRLLDLEKDIREFITQNEDKLKAKE